MLRETRDYIVELGVAVIDDYVSYTYWKKCDAGDNSAQPVDNYKDEQFSRIVNQRTSDVMLDTGHRTASNRAPTRVQ